MYMCVPSIRVYLSFNVRCKIYCPLDSGNIHHVHHPRIPIITCLLHLLRTHEAIYVSFCFIQAFTIEVAVVPKRKESVYKMIKYKVLK